MSITTKGLLSYLQAPRGTYGWKWFSEKVAQVYESTLIVAKHGVPDLLLYYNGGIGDELLMTIVLRELRQRSNRKVWFRTRYPEMFLYNEDADLFISGGFGLRLWMRLFRREAIYPMYIRIIKGADYYLPPPCHIITRMCQLVGIRGEITLRPYLKPTPQELEAGKLTVNQVAIQSSSLDARFPHRNKQWYPERYQAVVDALASRVNFVQLGSLKDPPLQGALDMRGKTTLRETAAILSGSQALVGQVGFLMHLARAVDTRAVIIYGGKELPHQSGYSCNENLVTRLPCSPCWLENACDFQRECMNRIQPEMVVAALERQLAKAGEPLPVDVDRVPDEVVPIEVEMPVHLPSARMGLPDNAQSVEAP